MDSNSVAPPNPNGDTISGHEHGLSIGQLVGSPTPSPLHTTGQQAAAAAASSSESSLRVEKNNENGRMMQVDTPSTKVERSEDGLRALADAVMGGGGGQPVVDDERSGGVTDVEMESVGNKYHQEEPKQPQPSLSASYPQSTPTQHPNPPFLNPLQSTAPPPSSTMVEPSRSPGLEVDSIGGSVVASAVASPAPVPVTVQPVVVGNDVVMDGVYGNGDGSSNGKGLVNGSYVTQSEIGGGQQQQTESNESNGKRSMDDEEMGDEERYAKRARETDEEVSV